MKFLKSSFYCAFAAVLLATLSGCGGGGSAGTSVAVSAFDSTMFQGNWNRNDGTGTNCFNFNDFGGPYGVSYGGLNRPVVITDTTIVQTTAVYSDNTCTTYLGFMVRNYAIVWSAGSLAGETNVARGLLTSTGSSINHDGAAGFGLASIPATGVISKSLFKVSGTLLYIGDRTATADADGYPSALQNTALYTR